MNLWEMRGDLVAARARAKLDYDRLALELNQLDAAIDGLDAAIKLQHGRGNQPERRSVAVLPDRLHKSPNRD